MTDMDRETVTALDRKRRNLRNALSDDVSQARHDLHPRTLKQRWMRQKRLQLADLATHGTQSLKKNAPLIGLASVGILLFTARKPISQAINQLRQKSRQTKDPKS